MKKFLSLLLVLCMVVPFAVLAEGAAPVKTGLSFTISLASSKDGQAQVYTHVGMFTLNGNVITSAYIDAAQPTVKFSAEGKVTSDLTAPVQTKNEIKEGYGMKAISSIGKEWYEQAAGFCAFITGKTLEEAIAIAANPGETDVVASCTIGVSDFQQLLIKAAQ